MPPPMQTLREKNYVATPFGQYQKHTWPQSSSGPHNDAFAQESIDNYVNVLPSPSSLSSGVNSFMNLHELVNGLSGMFKMFSNCILNNCIYPPIS